MADSAGDHNQHQQQQEHEQGPTPDPTDDLWKVAEGAVQLAGLYFKSKQNEGAAHMATALVLLMHLWRTQS
jgi:hypothetical protein